MQDLFRVVVLGIVQGLTEFLPISSSGHLIVARELFGWEFSNDLTVDVALHLGTTLAVLAFFWREWAQMLGSGARWVAGRGRVANTNVVFGHRMLFLLFVGSLPAAAVGAAFDSYIEENVRSPLVVGAMLIVFAAVLYAAERLSDGERRIGSSGWADAVWVGCAQAVSLVPGVSRAGVTISAALSRGYRREDAARFSFLLATPVIIGAGGLKILEAVADGIPREDIGLLLAGAAVAAITGWMAIGYLLRLVRTTSFLPFVVYRVVVGVFVLVYFGLF